MVSEIYYDQQSKDFNRLNPCSCGGWSQRVVFPSVEEALVKCLNPCSCGGWSQSQRKGHDNHKRKRVLILVLVEDGLRDKGYESSQNQQS